MGLLGAQVYQRNRYVQSLSQEIGGSIPT